MLYFFVIQNETKSRIIQSDKYVPGNIFKPHSTNTPPTHSYCLIVLKLLYIKKSRKENTGCGLHRLARNP